MPPLERSALVKALVDPAGKALRSQSVTAGLRGAQAAGDVRQGMVEFGNGVGGDQHPKPVEDHRVVHSMPRG
jgi:hypothetical protein